VQKILVNEIVKRDNRQEYVSNIQVYETTQYRNAIINQECQRKLSNKIWNQMRDIFASNVFKIIYNLYRCKYCKKLEISKIIKYQSRRDKKCYF